MSDHFLYDSFFPYVPQSSIFFFCLLVLVCRGLFCFDHPRVDCMLGKYSTTEHILNLYLFNTYLILHRIAFFSCSSRKPILFPRLFYLNAEVAGQGRRLPSPSLCSLVRVTVTLSTIFTSPTQHRNIYRLSAYVLTSPQVQPVDVVQW
jgi:hypothetical protein